MAHLRIPSLGASASSPPPLPEGSNGAPVVEPDAPKPQPQPQPQPAPVPTIPVTLPMPGQQSSMVTARTVLQAHPWIIPAGGSLLGLLIGLTVGVAIGKHRRPVTY